MTSQTAESPAEDRRTTGQPITRPELVEAASGALSAAAAQLRDYAGSGMRDRVLIDVMAVDLTAFADWLDRRAWLLGADPTELARQVPELVACRLDDDDELLPSDPLLTLAGGAAEYAERNPADEAAAAYLTWKERRR